jgi:hypothetical protein
MGTRHLVCVYHKGRIVLAQYGQFDGYPSNAGVYVLKFLTPANIERLRAGLERIQPYAAYEQGELYINSRLGAGILAEVAEAGDRSAGIEAGMDPDFANNGLMCEWVYVVDVDGCVLQVYKGNGDWEGPESSSTVTEGRLGEAKVRGQIFMASFGFAELPDEDEFVKTCEPPTEDYDDEEEASGQV